jgi:valyl-tRNA synthetase
MLPHRVLQRSTSHPSLSRKRQLQLSVPSLRLLFAYSNHLRPISSTRIFPRPILRVRQHRAYTQSMALNAASHNIPGEKTGPVTAAPPSLSAEAKGDILESASSDATGQSAPGKDGGDKAEGKKVKSEKELEKERKKAEKDAKFKAKKAAQAQAAGGAKEAGQPKESKKAKAKKEEALPEYVEETKPGEKKILKSLDDAYHKAYIPKVVESAWNDWWESEGFFKPELQPNGTVKEKGNFVIPIRKCQKSA